MKSDSTSVLRLAVIATLAVVLMSLAGEQRSSARIEWLMQGTLYETRLHVLTGDRAGPDVLILGGVHGDEPGGWLAAEALIERGPPEAGRLLVIPRANKLAGRQQVRSTPEIGDLNRLYFSDPTLFPMAQMAHEIVEVARRYDVDVVLDLHESWDFHDPDAGEVELSTLGQTISPHRSEPSLSITQDLVEDVNTRLPPRVHFSYHEFPPGHVDDLIVPLPSGVSEEEVTRKSGMDIPEALPGIASILVEVGQQQPLERRVAQHVAVADALLDLLGSSGDPPVSLRSR